MKKKERLFSVYGHMPRGNAIFIKREHDLKYAVDTRGPRACFLHPFMRFMRSMFLLLLLTPLLPLSPGRLQATRDAQPLSGPRSVSTEEAEARQGVRTDYFDTSGPWTPASLRTTLVVVSTIFPVSQVSFML